MSRQGRNNGLPRWYKGRKLRCDISDEELYELDGSAFKQRGLNVSKQNFDSLTDEERADAINQNT